MKKLLTERFQELAGLKPLNEAANCWGTANDIFGFNFPGGDECKECTGCGNIPCTGNLHSSKEECEEAQDPTGLTRGPSMGPSIDKPGMGGDMMYKRR